MNSHLMTRIYQSTDSRFKNYCKFMNKILFWLPPSYGVVYRKISGDIDFYANLNKGSTLYWKGFTSTSRKKDLPWIGNIIFEMILSPRYCQVAADISVFSKYPKEEEVLVGPHVGILILETPIRQGETLLVRGCLFDLSEEFGNSGLSITDARTFEEEVNRLEREKLRIDFSSLEDCLAYLALMAEGSINRSGLGSYLDWSQKLRELYGYFHMAGFDDLFRKKTKKLFKDSSCLAM